jgi:AcrR family transcriptional regulator
MRAAARAACMSIGGLYHHFPTKQELVLHGLNAEAIARTCHEFFDSVGSQVNFASPGFVDAYIDYMIASLRFIRPALHAALELRLETLPNTLEPALTAAADQFVRLFRMTFPHTDEAEVYQAGRAIHRVIVSALMDKTMTEAEFRSQVSILIDGYPVLQPAIPVRVPEAVGIGD